MASKTRRAPHQPLSDEERAARRQAERELLTVRRRSATRPEAATVGASGAATATAWAVASATAARIRERCERMERLINPPPPRESVQPAR